MEAWLRITDACASVWVQTRCRRTCRSVSVEQPWRSRASGEASETDGTTTTHSEKRWKSGACVSKPPGPCRERCALAHTPASTSWRLFLPDRWWAPLLFQVRRFLEKRRMAKARPLDLLWIGQKGLTDSRRAELKQQVEEYITVHKVRDFWPSFVSCSILCMLLMCVVVGV